MNSVIFFFVVLVVLFCFDHVLLPLVRTVVVAAVLVVFFDLACVLGVGRVIAHHCNDLHNCCCAKLDVRATGGVEWQDQHRCCDEIGARVSVVDYQMSHRQSFYFCIFDAVELVVVVLEKKKSLVHLVVVWYIYCNGLFYHM